MASENGVSVIICCYNSEERLPQTLAHIATQKFHAPVDWELIIVNNNSTDHTRDVAEAFSKQHPELVCKIIDEPNAGLSFARLAGFREAAFEYMILCDDDNWLQENYLQQVYDIFHQDPSIAIVGGIGEGVTKDSFPEWFSKRAHAFAVGQPFPAGYVKYVFGAGMALRRSVLFSAERRGFVSLLTDRKGKELSSGGDLELCYVVQLMGYKIFLSDQLHFKHYIDSSRLNDDYWSRLNTGFAKTFVTLRPYDLVRSHRKESPEVLWYKEYAYLFKVAVLNLFKKNEDWTYLSTAIKCMWENRSAFRSNIVRIRNFADNNNLKNDQE